MIQKLALFLKKHEKGFYMSHQYVLTMCTLLRRISPLRHTQARPAGLIFLAITRFNWWNRTKSTSSTTTEQLCSPRRGKKTGKKHEQTEFYEEKGKSAQRRRQRGCSEDFKFFRFLPFGIYLVDCPTKALHVTR